MGQNFVSCPGCPETEEAAEVAGAKIHLSAFRGFLQLRFARSQTDREGDIT